MTETKLRKAELDALRIAVVERLVGTTSNSLIISNQATKRNAAARAVVERLRELGLVTGVRLTEEGIRIGTIEHERVQNARRAQGAS
jgi:hypothetical protein